MYGKSGDVISDHWEYISDYEKIVFPRRNTEIQGINDVMFQEEFAGENGGINWPRNPKWCILIRSDGHEEIMP